MKYDSSRLKTIELQINLNRVLKDVHEILNKTYNTTNPTYELQMWFLLCCVFVAVKSDLLLYNYTDNAYVCFPNNFSVDLPEFIFCNNFGYFSNASFVDLKTPYILNQSQLIWYWNIGDQICYFTFDGTTYFYHDTSGTVTLNDCDFIQTNNIAWDSIRNRFWLVVHSITFNNVRLFYIDRLSRVTGYSSILTGEKPIEVYWNGTDIHAIIIRNQSYYSIQFLNSIKVREIGSVNNTMLDFSSNNVTIYIVPENTTKLCQFYCPLPKFSSVFISSIEQSSAYNVSESSDFMLNLTRIENSTSRRLESSTFSTLQTSTSRSASSRSSFSAQYVYSNTDVIDVTTGPKIIDGVMYVPPGSYLEVYFPPESLTEGTTITVFTFSQLIGQFDYIGLAQTSCYVFDTRTTYGTNAITISILSASNTCDNAPIKSIFGFLTHG